MEPNTAFFLTLPNLLCGWKFKAYLKNIRPSKPVGVSKNNGTPQIIHLSKVFHYKPSILGYPYLRKHPYVHQYSPLEGHNVSLISGSLFFFGYKINSYANQLGNGINPVHHELVGSHDFFLFQPETKWTPIIPVSPCYTPCKLASVLTFSAILGVRMSFPFRYLLGWPLPAEKFGHYKWLRAPQKKKHIIRPEIPHIFAPETWNMLEYVGILMLVAFLEVLYSLFSGAKKWVSGEVFHSHH